MKPYTWSEIKEFLEKDLKRTKHILTFGTIGSCNVEHDVDVIITKKPSSKTANLVKLVPMNPRFPVKSMRFSLCTLPHYTEL